MRRAHPPSPAPRLRAGTVLIMVAGISALMLSLAIAFLARMRSDAEEMADALRLAQARIMLSAACCFIQEASRIGWQTGAANEETFGWIDVRDGSLGPKITLDEPSDGHRFPIGAPALRCPMYVMERPPYAIRLTTTYNPVLTEVSTPPVPTTASAHGRPWLRNPDPQPVVANGWSGYPGAGVNATRFLPSSATDLGSYAAGDPRPRAPSQEPAWFRIYRDGPATFIITCGCGGTLGYRRNEVKDDAQALAAFGGDLAVFDDLLAHECRQWYRVEWSGAVMSTDYHALDTQLTSSDAKGNDNYMTWAVNAFHSTANHDYKTQMHACNMGGTISWVQRLATEPTSY